MINQNQKDQKFIGKSKEQKNDVELALSYKLKQKGNKTSYVLSVIDKNASVNEFVYW